MSDHAALLRRAVKLIRETAQAATHVSWWAHRKDDELIAEPPEDTAHIALWHPGVALAVAVWLEDTADTAENDEREFVDANPLAVARAVLGEDTTE